MMNGRRRDDDHDDDHDDDDDATARRIAPFFQQAREADTIEAMNALVSSNRRLDAEKLVFYVVSADWMRDAWPVLSSSMSQRGNNNSGDGSGGRDRRARRLGTIENSHLLPPSSPPSDDGDDNDKDNEDKAPTISSASSSDDEGQKRGDSESRNGKTQNGDNGNSSNGSLGGRVSPRRFRANVRTQRQSAGPSEQRRQHLPKPPSHAGRLAETATLDADYVLVGSNAWLLLQNKFGCDVEIPRKCVVTPEKRKNGANGANDFGGVDAMVEEEASPLSIVVQPAQEADGKRKMLPEVLCPVPPSGRFPYESVLLQQHRVPPSRPDAAADSSNNPAAAPAAGAGSSPSSSPPSVPHRQQKASIAVAAAAAAAARLRNNAGAADGPGNVSDDEDDLFPHVGEDDDRMSMDNNNGSGSSGSGSGPDRRPTSPSGQHQQPVLLLPSSTSSNNITSSPGAFIGDNNNNNNSNSHPRSPSSSVVATWLAGSNNNNNDNKNDDSDNDIVGAPSTGNGVLVAPGQLRYRYGSGLANMGNTCFMNSTLQCLAHTELLRKYFLSGEYQRDLNRDNPLGTGGDLAIEFASLLGQMWGTTNRTNSAFGTTMYPSSSSIGPSIWPRAFKQTLGRHAEQFVGYDQHDSQELATYLLDALHEDTNRVTKKPYVEKPEQGEDESDEEAADKAWDLHLKREDSRVLECFMGQIKSRVQCCKETCGRVSTTFDPSMYLSVPIPGSSERTIRLTYIPLDPSMRPVEVPVGIGKTASFRELGLKLVQQLKTFQVLSEEEMIEQDDLVFAEVYLKKVFKFFDPEKDTVEDVADHDKIFAYHLQPLAEIQKLEEEHGASASAQPRNDQDLGLVERKATKRYKLDLSTLRLLNPGEQWRTEVAKYLSCSYDLRFATAFNAARGSTADRVKWYNRVVEFLDACYADAESEITGQKRMRDEERGSTEQIIASSDEDPIPCIRDRCHSTPFLLCVASRHDLAKLEFCARKMRTAIIDLDREKKSHHPNGILLQIQINQVPDMWYQEPLESFLLPAPLVVRVPSSTNVHDLRKILAKRLSRVLNTGPHYRSSSAAGESTSERPSSAIPNDDSSYSSGGFDDPNLLTMRRVPLSYKRGPKGPYPRGSLGVLCGEGESRDGSRPVSLASRFADEEKALVAQVVGDRGRVYLETTSTFAERYLVREEIERVDPPAAEPVAGMSRTQGTINVLDCIEKYCQNEQLEETEMWYCNRCKEHVRAWKQLHLYRSPPILFVHLKRFEYAARSHRRSKIDTLVEFPLEGLDLTGQAMHWTEEEKPIYDCYAVSHHFGGLGGGHYTAHALNDDGVWCYYDDSRVTTDVDPKEVVSNSAYLLFYRRRDVPVGEQFIPSTLTSYGGAQTPAIIQDPLENNTDSDKVVGDSSDGASSSNAAMVDEDEQMDVDGDTDDVGSRSTSPMGSVEGSGDNQRLDYSIPDDDAGANGGRGGDGRLGRLPLQ